MPQGTLQGGAFFRSRGRGQSLVEMAISVPFLLTMVLGSTDLGRAFYYREQVSNAARQALRIAVSPGQQATGNSVCSGGGSATSAVPASGSSTIQTIANEAGLENSRNGTAAGSVISGATVKVTWHCSNGSAVTNATNQGVTDPNDPRSDSVDVQVSYAMPLVTAFATQLIGSPNVTLVVDVKGRAEY